MSNVSKVIACVGILAVGFLAGRQFHGKTDDDSQAIQKLRDEFSKSFAQIDKRLESMTSVVGNEGDVSLTEIDDATLHSLGEAEAFAKSTGDKPTAEKLALTAATLESWSFRPDDEKQVLEMKAGLLKQLRAAVKAEIASLQEKALKAASGGEAAKLHSEAGRTLALYPMSDEKQVLDEAQQLSAQQVAVAARIEVIRRQRYNLWATKQIEAAIDGYNKNKSYLSPLKENALLIDSLVKSLGEIDPMQVEPVVLELYNYVVDVTKGSISEKDKVQLATRLSDPSIRRKALGDF